jgi:peptidoglycan/LPS O-acetylase OafA/YrhL
VGQDRYPELDGIRGLAICLVFILHYGGGARSSNSIVRLAGLFIQGGWSGVTLFFVLSGFLISGILWDMRGRPDWLRVFYTRRVLRIFPLYYASLLIILLTAAAFGNTLHCLRNLWIDALYLQDVQQLWQRSQDNGSRLWTSHLWSLAIEEQFYLLWPFLLMRMTGLEQAKRLCIGVFLCSFAYRCSLPYLDANPVIEAGAFFLSRCGELALGAYLAMLFRQPNVWERLQKWAPPIAVVALGAFFGIARWDRTMAMQKPTMNVYGLAAISIFYGMLLVMALGGGATSSIMKSAFLRRMGTISYGFYIFHVLLTPVIDWLAELTMHLMPHAGSNIFNMVRLLVAGGVSYFAASLSFRYYESYFLELRSKVRPKRDVAVAA